MKSEKVLIVKEYDIPIPGDAAVLDLSDITLRHCLGCWTCWLTTPGRCVHKDLDEFYRNYLAVDTVYIYCEAVQGFVSANLKAMIDRMIPLILPYISWATGESLHKPRYGKYPKVEIVYKGNFLPGEEDAFVDYWRRTAYMMFSPSFTARRYDA